MDSAPDFNLRDIICSLQHLYGRNWVNAMGIIDGDGVSCYRAEPSGRTVYLVRAYVCEREGYDVY